MDSMKDDPRFSHIASDPRFRPMPKSKKKVKIDNRFQSIFTSNDYSHRTDIDKRGRPLLNGSKKQKHVMERFYDLSDSDSSEERSDEEQITNKKIKVTTSPTVQETLPTKKRKLNESKTEGCSSKRKKDAIASKNSNKGQAAKADFLDNKDEEVTQKASKKKLTTPSKKVKIEESSNDEDSEEVEFGDNSDSEGAEDSIDEMEEGVGSDSGVEDEVELDDDVVEYTKDFAIEETDVDHRWNELQADAVPVSDSTSRLAVCNMDWDFVKAQDLFVLFKSFVPEGGILKSVTIYPSEFGKERMAEEALLGPREMRKDKDEDDVSVEKKKGKKGKHQKSSDGDQQKEKRLEKNKESAQTEKLREYQLNRLRYYYAVVDCDSVATADNIYNECDGREYQLSSVRLDLRFIPDDMTFDDEPKECFTEDQGVLEYQPSKFNSTALSQAKVEVTWDETEFDRLSRRVKALQQKELESMVEENKYSDLIAPPESDSEEEGDGRPEWLKAVLEEGEEDEEKKPISEEEKIKLYRKVLMDKIAEENDNEKEEEGEFDKEMVWQPGLKSAAEKKLKKQSEKKEQNAIVGGYLESKKKKMKKKKEEKANKKKEESNGDGDEQLAFSDDEIPAGFDIKDMKEMLDGEEGFPPGKSDKKKKKNGRKDKKDDVELDEKSKAELELILMDADSGLAKKPAKPKVLKDSEGKKGKKKKKKELAKLKKENAEKEEFDLDLEDPRFSAIYSSHHFHIDPTAPQFKKTKNMLKLVDEQISRKKSKKKNVSGRDNEVNDSIVSDNGVQNTDRSTSQSLLESLKRKMKKGASK